MTQKQCGFCGAKIVGELPLLALTVRLKKNCQPYGIRFCSVNCLIKIAEEWEWKITHEA